MSFKIPLFSYSKKLIMICKFIDSGIFPFIIKPL